MNLLRSSQCSSHGWGLLFCSDSRPKERVQNEDHRTIETFLLAQGPHTLMTMLR